MHEQGASFALLSLIGGQLAISLLTSHTAGCVLGKHRPCTGKKVQDAMSRSSERLHGTFL